MWGSRQAGQAMVELAISWVVIVLILGASVDISHGFQIDVTLHDAAREGARHGVWFNVAGANNPYFYDAEIKSTVDTVLTHNGLSASVLQNPTTTCPTPSDGNSYYNAPYVASAAPTTPGATYLYICYNGTPGTDRTVAPTDNSYELQDLNVIVVHRLSFLEPYLPSEGIGSIVIAENQHMAVQGD